jgi:hypothetical protein
MAISRIARTPLPERNTQASDPGVETPHQLPPPCLPALRENLTQIQTEVKTDIPSLPQPLIPDVKFT